MLPRGGQVARPLSIALFRRGKDPLLCRIGRHADFSDGALQVGNGDAMAACGLGEQACVVDGVNNGLHVAGTSERAP